MGRHRHWCVVLGRRAVGGCWAVVQLVGAGGGPSSKMVGSVRR